MKKCIIAGMTVLVLMIVGLSLYSVHKGRHCYDRVETHSKLLKEIAVDTRDSACYREWGIYKKVYRKYNYVYTDSTYGNYYIGDSISVGYWSTDVGDTVFIEYRYCGEHLYKIRQGKEK